jgi:hypothetical protein
MAHQIPQAVNAIATPRIYVPNIDGEIIQVQAGEQLFHIHEGVLRQYLFFIDAIKPECVSGRNGKPIDLSSENAITFAAYQQYLYSHQTDTTLNEHLWCRMYVLREMLLGRRVSRCCPRCHNVQLPRVQLVSSSNGNRHYI